MLVWEKFVTASTPVPQGTSFQFTIDGFEIVLVVVKILFVGMEIDGTDQCTLGKLYILTVNLTLDRSLIDVPVGRIQQSGWF